MAPTRFWLIRHAIVAETARTLLYGRMDVEVCDDSMRRQEAAYQALASRLPRGATWFVTPLSRTGRTASALQLAGYPPTEFAIEPGLTEQDLGEWQGLTHAELPPRLIEPAHAFWPLAANEIPPGGESIGHVVQRVGETLERLATSHRGRDIVAISHGGAIRAAVAHAAGISGHSALHFAVQNLSLTVLERFEAAWRIVCVNETGPHLEA